MANSIAPVTYQHILDRLVAEHGHRLVRQMEAKHVEVILTAKAATPAAANKLRKLLLLIMRVAVLNGWRKDNPVSAVRGIRVIGHGLMRRLRSSATRIQ